jgi:poly(3-hydroxybutyrate) depolymerase
LLYHLYDLQHALLTPARLTAELARDFYSSPWNPLSFTQAGRTLAANAEMVERVTRRFGKPDFGLGETVIDGETYGVTEQRVLEKPFCTLVHFRRELKKKPRKDPQVLLVAPMSGHYATLLRGTVEALLPHHDVYVTDWHDARQVPLDAGRFNLDDYIAYLIEFMSLLGPDTHVIAVCQPAVPVFAAVALMESWNDPNHPRSMTLMGGPIDTRVSKTQVTELAETRDISWFERSVVVDVPFYYPGAFRRVYPGFIQLGGFMSMNLDRHIGSHFDFYRHLIAGDGESAAAHRRFYNEYLSVMDITAEFYLQTVETVFQKHSLPKGEMRWINPATGEKHLVDPAAVKRTALLTIEGELDDISAHGQTTAANVIAANLPAGKSYHHFQENVGHYGIFNGSKWRGQIMPRIRHFIRRFDDADPVPEKDLAAIPDRKPAQWDEKTHGIEAVRARLKKGAAGRKEENA